MIRATILGTIAVFLTTNALCAGMFEVQQVADHIWALEGPAENRNADNLANNATFGLIETSEGAVLVDPGGSYKGAAAIDAVIATLTKQPVKYVINTGGQDHRWLGNSYWQAKGAKIVSSNAAIADQNDRASMQLTVLSQLIGAQGLENTKPSSADIRFDTAYDLSLGGVEIAVRHVAPAHTPGDSFVWLAQSKTVFTGDIVYVGRVLGVMEFSSSRNWIAAFEAVAALEPAHLVPGHGPATTLAAAKADTYDYLVNLRTGMASHIDEGGDIIDAVNVDQSAFARLAQFDALAGRNAQRVFEEMEWE
ncbi:MAG: MBL fold metallo-hydrolase [Planktotalea sp.]|uniref:MBL fold metallo-hydrolase n=1 Tax=Planktotalea sp. TaxID=2029877 RepID=UPI003C73ED34